ncbi:MAG: DUF4126 domain-containing protein [Caldilineaceae bacterium]|nr:DUF4126 domain-containing protein [Caldilineaceae bacterium]
MDITLELLLSIAIGVGLAAAVGFRVFVPFTIISLAALSGTLDLAPGFEWIGAYPALLAFGVATVIEIAAYYVPWLDNLLDSIATPAAIVAGAVITASVVGDVSPLLRWSLAAIAGGGVAATVQAGTVLLRGTSSAVTGGLGNFAVSSAELLGAVLTSTVAIFLPVVAVVGVILVLWMVSRRIRRRNAPQRA